MGHVVVMDDSPEQLALTAYSAQLWRDLRPQLDARAEFDACGTLWIAEDSTQLEALEQKRATYRSARVAADVIDARELRDAEPGLRDDLLGALLVPDDAVIYPPGATIQPLQQASRTVPIVFAQAIDPVGAGNVETSARPNSNATGFLQFEYSLAGKWLELLREVAPELKRVGVIRDPGAPAGIGQWAVIQAAAQPLGIELMSVDLRGGAATIERSLTAVARVPNAGLIAVVSAAGQLHRELVATLSAKHRLPTVYPYRFFVTGGGLISYGPDLVSQYRRAAGYVDRILKGEKPADMPVQAPTKYELVINLKTAKALGLTIPPSLLATADEVIE